MSSMAKKYCLKCYKMQKCCNFDLKNATFKIFKGPHKKDLICIFLNIKIKAHQVPFQNKIYGLSWFCLQLVNELKQINMLVNFA